MACDDEAGISPNWDTHHSDGGRARELPSSDSVTQTINSTSTFTLRFHYHTLLIDEAVSKRTYSNLGRKLFYIQNPMHGVLNY
jgi:hypothetical protein